MSINTELAAAVRRINALRAQIPADYRPPFDEKAWNALKLALAAADRERAVELIGDWEHNIRLDLFVRLTNAPLEKSEAA